MINFIKRVLKLIETIILNLKIHNNIPTYEYLNNNIIQIINHNIVQVS